ncbi:hypothetical protein E0Z10_g9756 [Xylaria hypoxylon]|uniref:Uncharacterized protein n=1 Tax=Xylaria hypoxylon TaxID=37992 RepID=A0A4Z0YJY4_9PEZI|nr:hypothetical protein E0Z10_g9756 [Xylaria hypoxylon]
MSTPQKQREIVQKRQTKMHDAQRKYDTQWNIVNIQVPEIRALSLQKEHLTREVATLKLRYEVSLGTIQRHQQRLEESGRPGGNGEFEKNARKELEKEKKKCAHVEDKIKAIAKTIEKAQKNERKAREKLDELHNKLAEAKIQVKIEQGRLLQLADRHRIGQ